MAEKLNDREVVKFEELLIVNMVQVDAVTQLLIEKGVFTQEEFFAKLKNVRHEYESKRCKKQ